MAELVLSRLDALNAKAARRGDRREADNHADALTPLARLLGHLPVSDLRPKALRAALVTAASGKWLTAEEREERKLCGRKLRWSLDYANRNLSRWKAAVLWAEGEELVPPGSHAAIASCRGLEEGEAERRPDVAPVREEAVRSVLPKLNRVVRALIETLLWTGARPGELCRLTPGGLDRSGEVEIAKGYRVKLGEKVWAWQPQKHKTAWKGHKRVILFGPHAQAILAPLLEGRPPARPIFCPQEASKRPLTGTHPPRLNYDHRSLGHALGRACRRAEVEPFSAYQLRHAAAARLASEFGPEFAQIVLGHGDLKTTEIYAKLGKVAHALGEAG